MAVATWGSLQAGSLSPLLAHGELRYMLFMPYGWRRQHAAAQRHPTILFLHGAGSMNNHRNLRKQGMCRRLLDPETAKAMPFIVVLPITPVKGGWPPWFQGVMSLLGDVLGGLGGDPARVYALGQSMGGNGAWLLAAAHPEHF